MLFPPERQEYELVYTKKEREADIYQKFTITENSGIECFDTGAGSVMSNVFDEVNRIIISDLGFG